jgi:leucyl-tRNA synthetase
LYLGGSEHATGHLLYVRFWTMFLKDRGYISFDEPAKKLINQGMIQGRSNFVYRVKGKNQFVSYGLKDQYDTTKLHVDVNLVDNDILNIEAFKAIKNNIHENAAQAEFILENGKYICGHEVEKMSKSKWNVVSPDDICEKFGADTLRLYEMFLGPLELSKPWNTNGITGVSGFLKKLWRLFHANGSFTVSEGSPDKKELKAIHKTIKKITEDIERFSFNTSVSNFMICVNELTDLKCNNKIVLEQLLVLISPYAPHITEELWEKLGHLESISTVPFPIANEEYLKETSFSYPVSFNGKTRFNIEFDLALSKEDVEKEVLAQEQTLKYLEGKNPKKVIVVPGKIINIVL